LALIFVLREGRGWVGRERPLLILCIVEISGLFGDGSCNTITEFHTVYTSDNMGGEALKNSNGVNFIVE
jgi:hypothetical protein